MSQRWLLRGLTVIGLAWVAGQPAPVQAQGRAEDYERADGLAARARGKVTHDRVQPHWFAGGDRFSFRSNLGDDQHEFVLVDARTGTRRPAFDHARLAAALAKALAAPVDAGKLPLRTVEVGDDGVVRFNREARDGWRYNPATDELTKDTLVANGSDEDDAPEPRRQRANFARPTVARPDQIPSPDGRYQAFVRDEVVRVRVVESKEEFAIPLAGRPQDGRDRGLHWSPDSTKLVIVRTTPGDDRRVSLIASAPSSQLQPQLSSYFYLKPGDRVPIDRPYLFDVAERKAIDVPDAQFNNPYDLDHIRWSEDSRRFTFLYNQRGHQALRVFAVDSSTGQPTLLIDESSPTFVDYSNKTYFEWTPQGDEILWMSERSGWNHLYLLDAATGAVRNPITQGHWLIKQVDDVNYAKRELTLQVMGLDPKEDPYHIHVVRVKFDGSGFVRLTEGDGNHRVRYSPDRRFVLDTYSRVDLPPVTELRRVEDGQLVAVVERADASKLDAAGLHRPERFVSKGRDGATDIHGIIIRPTNFDPAKRYPVIEAIYAGPQGAFVPKAFRAVPAHQALADLGFIVVQIDGMGTNWRSRAFHDVCSKNLGDAGFPDRILWMKAAAGREPSMDLRRVGIFGGSAGGQNALGGMLFHGDFYKAAVADCGCHDNRMDKIWWNEAWMGWPIGPHYAEQSNVTNAHKLVGPLLLTVGELDHNVDPASTMQVVNALIRAGKDFDLIVFPGADHGAGGAPYGDRRRRDFFVRHLLGVDPPRRNLAALDPAGPTTGDLAARPGDPRAASAPPDLDSDPAETEDW